VPWTVHALERLGQVADVDASARVRRIQRRLVRHVNSVDSGFTQHREVRLDRPRVALEVLARAELQRVDEDADDDPRRVRASGRYQAHVPGVKRAHSRHQADRLAGHVPFAGKGPHLFRRLDD